MSTVTARIASPLMWIGGKNASAERIVSAFPSAHSYDTYVEVFGGAAHVLVRKPPYKHIEVYNDLNYDLVRFWMAVRDQPEAIQQRIDTLPYSRSLYSTYRKSLQLHESMDDLERAARWFYLLRSTFGGSLNFSKGWGYGIRETGSKKPHALRTATALLFLVAERFRYVQVEHQDFASMIQTYQTTRTLFYADPPYVGCEDYYDNGDMPPFIEKDHRRLATLLNATPAFVALSYYAHPFVDELYPLTHWRRLNWTQAKAVEKTRGNRHQGHEVLLMNYPEALSLWEAAQ